MSILRVAIQALGWLCVVGAGAFAVYAGILDDRMQTFRPAEAKGRSYSLIPLRWQRHLYRSEGGMLVDGAWRAIRRMVGLFVIGSLLIIYTLD